MKKMSVVVKVLPFIGNIKLPYADVTPDDVVVGDDKREKKNWVERRWFRVFAVSGLPTTSGNTVPCATAGKIFTDLNAAKAHAKAFAYHLDADYVEVTE